MNQLKKISIKFMKSNKILSFACIMSILITVVLIVTMLNFSYNISKEFDLSISKADDYNRSIQAITVYLYILCGLVLVISGLLIASIYFRYLEKSNQSIVTLRSIGASASNIYEIMMFQSLFMNGVACLFGFILTLIINHSLLEWLGKTGGWISGGVTYNYKQTILCIIIIFTFIQFVMIRFLKRTVQALPNQNLISKETQLKKGKKLFRWKMKALCIISLFYILTIIDIYIGNSAFFKMILCMVAFILLVFAFAKDYIMGIMSVLSSMFKKTGKTYAYIALQLIKPQVKENIFIILTIIFVFIFSFVGNNFLRMIYNNSINYYDKLYLKEILITPEQDIDSINYESGRKLEVILEDRELSPIATYSGLLIFLCYEDKVLTEDISLTSFDILKRESLISQDASNQGVVISTLLADKYGIIVGDKVEIIRLEDMNRTKYGSISYDTYNPKLTKEYLVVDILDMGYHSVFIDNSNQNYISKYTYLNGIYVSELSKEGKPNKEIDQTLEELRNTYAIKWSKHHEAIELADKITKEQVRMFTASINILFIVICFGMLNSMNNIILSRKKEYNILRYLGVKKSNVVKVILVQIMTYIGIGAIIGTIVGIFIISNLNFIDYRRWIINVSFQEVLILAGILLVVELGTIPSIRKILRN